MAATATSTTNHANFSSRPREKDGRNRISLNAERLRGTTCIRVMKSGSTQSGRILGSDCIQNRRRNSESRIIQCPSNCKNNRRVSSRQHSQSQHGNIRCIYFVYSQLTFLGTFAITRVGRINFLQFRIYRRARLGFSTHRPQMPLSSDPRGPERTRPRADDKATEDPQRA